MGDGHEMTAAEIRKKYRGASKDLGDLLASLLTRKPPCTILDRGHGVRVYCGCPERHMKSVAGTPNNLWVAIREVKSWANRCSARA
jgi:hypothetical protein